MNLKVRINNPIWWSQILLSITMPMLAYFGMNLQDLTSWPTLGNIFLQAVGNPYVLGLVIVSVWNACNDPTTKGFSDSDRAKEYDKPV